MDDHSRFCDHCGARLSQNDINCPECGRPTGFQGQFQQTAPVRSAIVVDVERMSKSASLFLGVFALISIIEGISYMLMNGNLAELTQAAYSADEWTDFLRSIGLSSTAEYSKQLFMDGVITLIDGIAVGIAFLLYRARKMWTLCFSLCIYGSFFLFAVFFVSRPDVWDIILLIVQCIVGLMVSGMIRATKVRFVS